MFRVVALVRRFIDHYDGASDVACFDSDGVSYLFESLLLEIQTLDFLLQRLVRFLLMHDDVAIALLFRSVH